MGLMMSEIDKAMVFFDMDKKKYENLHPTALGMF